MNRVRDEGILNRKRLVFIDLIRALAAVMMVQGHTVDVFLSNAYRDETHLGFSLWLFLRGLTAPIFLFTTGTVFMYLLKSNGEPFPSNPRVGKGLKRAPLLIVLGYLLRYPSSTIIHLSFVSEETWRIFFAVDVLQLIGFSLLFMLGLAFLAERFNLDDYRLFFFSGWLFFACYPFAERIEWADFLPGLLAGYLYFGSGSNFPLFPWAGYVLCGGVLGAYLANHREVFTSFKFSSALGVSGLFLLAVYQAAKSVEAVVHLDGRLVNSPPSLIFQRFGAVLILYAVVSRISALLKTLPQIILLIGRNTLPIYVVHLIVLYGSPWNHGLDKYLGKSLAPWQSAGAVMLMLMLMLAIVAVYERVEPAKGLSIERSKAG